MTLDQPQSSDKKRPEIQTEKPVPFVPARIDPATGRVMSAREVSDEMQERLKDQTRVRDLQ